MSDPADPNRRILFGHALELYRFHVEQGARTPLLIGMFLSANVGAVLLFMAGVEAESAFLMGAGVCLSLVIAAAQAVQLLRRTR